MAYLVKKIDIHVHCPLKKGCPRLDGTDYATPEELKNMYASMGIERGVQLPGTNPEGSSRIVNNEMSMELVEAYPDMFSWFCNIDPRFGDNSPNTNLSHFINYYKEKGAKGIGEVCANLPFDDPLMENLFYHAEKCAMPLIFHIGNHGEDYGIVDGSGLYGLEGALKKFPKLRFLGHSQKFWAEISGGEIDDRDGYPTGKVIPGGRVVELMRKYPNLCGDLSAGSGENAVMRDPEFGYAFLDEFQDRLYFGTDICSPHNIRHLHSFLDEAVMAGKISQQCYNKVCRENALKLLAD